MNIDRAIEVMTKMRTCLLADAEVRKVMPEFADAFERQADAIAIGILAIEAMRDTAVKTTKRNAHWSRKLRLLSACSEAVAWAKTQKTFAAAWKTCARGDWMLWLASKLSGSPESDARKKLVLAACACARLALKHVKLGEDRPRICIETTEKWARGEDGITIDDVRKARRAAEDGADAAAYAAAYAAADAAAARSKVLAECADVVRAQIKAPNLGAAR
jgi:hypothetical protein